MVVDVTRDTRDEWAMTIAIVTSKRSTCLRRRVGAVLLNERGHLLASGYNGVASGLPHCNEIGSSSLYPHACSGARAKSGEQLDRCGAIHAEQNALLQCKNVYEIESCYVTASPCLTCVKLLLNTSCKRIVFLDGYPHDSEKLWVAAGRDWIQLGKM
jgi:dCMP deaminase